MIDFVDDLKVPVLTKSALACLLVDQMSINGREARELVELFFDLILERLSKGEDVKLAGFGNFEVHQKMARPGRNPRTGESVEVSPRQIVRFSTGPKFKRQMMDKRSPRTRTAPEKLDLFIASPCASSSMPESSLTSGKVRGSGERSRR